MQLLVVLVGIGAAVRLQPGPQRSPMPAAATQVVHGRIATPDRLADVRQLLARRSAAVLHRDRAAFLATVDPGSKTFLAGQAAVFDHLAGVPLANWSYELDDRNERAQVPARRGRWWAPDVTLRYALKGFDRTPAVQAQALTFLSRNGHWLLAADDGVTRSGQPAPRELWDTGPVTVARGRACLVLGHPAGAGLVRALVGDCDAAVLRVTAVWGGGWTRRVVLVVPDSTAELARLVPQAGELRQIAAVATAELVSPTTGYHPAGDRVLVNPRTFAALGALGRRVVLTHEVTHVASRAATGRQLPTWLVEGLADYVGYTGTNVPLAAAAQELRADVRAGRLPRRLPVDADFDGSRADLAQTYEMSWLAVTLLARTYGRDALLQVYRDAGADSGAGALDRATRKDLHLTLAGFTTAWRSDLERRLA